MPRPEPDYYAILNVSPSATLAQIKHAYRQLARRYHPDLNQSADSRIKQLNEAYAILSDAVKRAAYDKLRKDQQRAEAIADMIRQQQEELKRIPKMTWPEGIAGFFREFKKEIREDHG